MLAGAIVWRGRRGDLSNRQFVLLDQVGGYVALRYVPRACNGLDDPLLCSDIRMSTSVGFDLSQVGQNNGTKGFAQGIGPLFRGAKQEQAPLNQFKGVLRRKLELLSSTAIFVKRSVNISFDVEGSWPLSEQTELMRVCCLKLAQAFFRIVADANLDQIRSFSPDEI